MITNCKHEKLTDPPMQSGQQIVATCPDCGAAIVYQCIILKFTGNGEAVFYFDFKEKP